MEHKDTKTQRAAQSVKTQSVITQAEYDRLQQLSNTIERRYKKKDKWQYRRNMYQLY